MMDSISEPLLKKLGLAFFLLLGFSIFLAKPAINIAYGLLILSALIFLFKFDIKKIWMGHRFMGILCIPIGIGFILSFFSMDGIDGSIGFFSRYRFLFLFLPFVIFVDTPKALLKIFIALNAGAFVDVIYCMLNSDLSRPFANIYGFHKFGRHSDMLFTLFLINATVLLIAYKKNIISEHIKFYSLVVINTCLIGLTIILIGQRGAYVGLYCGLIVLFFLYSKRLLVALILLTLISPFFAPDYVSNRVKSFIDPAQESNSERMQLLELGFTFLIEKNCWVRGTGAKNLKSELKQFLAEKPADYQEYFRDLIKLYPGNFHNSYLQMTIESGLLFAIWYVGAIVYLLFLMLKQLKPATDQNETILACALVCTAGFLISQIFHEEFFRYGGIIAFMCFYAGCTVLAPNAGAKNKQQG